MVHIIIYRRGKEDGRFETWADEEIYILETKQTNDS
jgi:hypothetical protein